MSNPQLSNLQNYYMFASLAAHGRCHIKTSEINSSNWSDYYEGILNLMKDGIELEEVQNFMIDVELVNDGIIQLSVFDLYFNIMMWYIVVRSNQPISGEALFFPEAMTQNAIKDYLDHYIDKIKRIVSPTELNNILDDTLYKFKDIDLFSMYISNTINLKDTIDLMSRVKEFNELIHTSVSDSKIEDVKDDGLKKAEDSIEIIEESEKYLGHDHCMKNSFMTGEGINKRQYKEFAINIGSKPNGQGGVHPYVIDKSYIMGGLDTVAAQFVDSASSRVAQIQTKKNTGKSGTFARIIGVNNMDTMLNQDMDYCCNTSNFQTILVENKKFLSMLDGRYYKLDPDGMDYLINAKKDTYLIGKTIYLYSPMTCASAAHGHGICRRCYGELAYINRNIRPGKLASEILSAQLTQKQLSAKHLLETVIEKFNWAAPFDKYFEIDVNSISPKEDTHGAYILIDTNTIYSDSDDSYVDSMEDQKTSLDKYITEFILVDKKGDRYTIKSAEDTEMYLTEEFNTYLTTKAELTEDDQYLVYLKDLVDEDSMMNIFFIQILNNDIGKNLKDIEKLINKKSSIGEIDYDKDSLLQRLVQLIIKGKLTIQSVHLEVILMNQIRSTRTRLRLPEWENPGEEYQILTLDQALKDNPSIINSLIYQKLNDALCYPLSFEKTQPSLMDLFFMERPQDFLSNHVKAPKKRELIDAVFEVPKE